MGTAQLKLVQQATEQPEEVTDPTRRIFGHWLTMFGKSPNRCKMGPTRRAAINAAMTLYDEDQVLMAIEGAASDPWVCGDNPMRRPQDDIEWILRNESSIERFSAVGEQLREHVRVRLVQRATAAAAAPVEDAPPDPLKTAEGIAAMRRAAARRSGRE